MRILNVETPRLVLEFEDRFKSLVVGQASAAEGFAKEEDCLGIDKALFNQIRTRGDEVLQFPMADVAPDLFFEGAPERHRAAIVERTIREAMIEPGLAGQPKVIRAHGMRPAVNVKDERKRWFTVGQAQPGLDLLPI